ncbi:MAG TPA: glycosyl hydrolase [Solirubrobacterales bacterium]|nr:glycosyl hydrolase [Solirubrobacterales bacterium]
MANWRAIRSRPCPDPAPADRKRSPRGRALGFGIGCLLAVSLLSAPGAEATVRAPASLYWGAQIGDQITGAAPPWDMNPVYSFEGIVGKGLSLVEFGTPFAECDGGACTATSFPDTPLQAIRNYGAIPVLSWNSSSSSSEVSQPEFTLAAIAGGRYDPYIREFALKARAWGHPFFLRFDWEMNGFWFPWNEGVNGNSPGEFVAAWRHVHDIFASVGATNATWVWCPNVDNYGNLTSLRELYPGDEYVDWTGLDGFNWGRRAGSPGWQTFNQVFHRTYRRIVSRVAPGKPMMLPEVASSDKGGDKPAWIEDMLGTIRHRYRKVRAVVWYDVIDRGTDWPIERRKQDYGAFRRGIGVDAYRPNEFGGIANSPIAPPDAEH